MQDLHIYMYTWMHRLYWLRKLLWDVQKGTHAPLHVYYSKYSFNVPLTVHTEPAAALWPFKPTFAPSIVQWVGTFLNLCALYKFDKYRKFRCALSPLTANDELLTICTRSFWSIKLVHNENLVRRQFQFPPSAGNHNTTAKAGDLRALNNVSAYTWWLPHILHLCGHKIQFARSLGAVQVRVCDQGRVDWSQNFQYTTKHLNIRPSLLPFNLDLL